MASKLWRSGWSRSVELQRGLGFSTSSVALRPASAASAEISAAATPEEAGRKWGFSVLLLLLPCAATFGLGSWQ